MIVQHKMVKGLGVRFFIKQDGKEIGRAFLYILHNNLHKRPFGFLEDVFVEEKARGQGMGSALVKRVIDVAQLLDCYKLVATSRYSRGKVHKMYQGFGFEDWGKEFRMNFK